MKKLKILLIGQPNVGKSSLLNALVGPKVTVSNYPGTTVELTSAKKRFNNTEIEFIDTPGIYSISDRSEEEKITEKTLFKGDIDGVIVLADTTSLEKSLYVILQILEAQIPTIVALNFVEDATKKGIKISSDKLEKILNIPIVKINPQTKMGINNLLDTVSKIKTVKNEHFRNEYDDHIEKAINDISKQIISPLSKRFVSLRILEEDPDFYKYLKNREIIKTINNNLKKNHPKVAEDICITRYGTASFIAEKVTQIFNVEKRRELGEQFDKILLHQTWGPLITFLSLSAIFGILLILGNFTQKILLNLSGDLLSSFSLNEQSVIAVLLNQALSGLTMGISIALPYVFLFYLLLGILEDIGLLSRFIFNAERFLGKIGLPGKSFIPLMLGFGCTVPATRATRVLSSKKEQFYTASLFAFVPCSSRIAIIMGIVGFYGGTILALAVFITAFIAGLIWAFTIKKFVHIKSEPLLLELPVYRKPLIKNVLSKSWIRMKDFIYVVIPLLILGGIAYGLLEIYNLTNIVINPLSPITSWLKLPKVTSIPLFLSFLQKDLSGAMLVSVLGNNIDLVLTPLQIYTFGTASTIGIPCIIALGMLIREFGFKKAIGLTVVSVAYGLFLAGLIARIILLL